ncbi:hypothetical protein [Nocardioides deserti]|uniref:Uncharacterized protein n=1 Tax=Nocardioides deserti TaxID=1588644 RepID=A0ABR6UC06_9ACTN|nr:hypothetical protein [Nocardioides deserti]MBC2961895.1 hypothetical protein [Nocardioides deserti]GGO79611.1 hypothetical protein GCM10012276_39730 [Nocardioides deserti]
MQVHDRSGERRRFSTRWSVIAFVVLALVVAAVVIAWQMQGTPPGQTDVGMPPPAPAGTGPAPRA